MIDTKFSLIFLLLVSLCTAGNTFAQCDADNGPCVEEKAASEPDAVAAPASSKNTDSSMTDATEVEVKKERIKPLWIGGLIAFGVSYIANITVTAALAEDEYRGKAVGFAAIPLVGQFISVAADSDDYPIPPEYKGPLVLGGILQIVSAGVFTAGMIIKREPKNKQAVQTPRFWVTPVTIGAHGAGAVLSITPIFPTEN